MYNPVVMDTLRIALIVANAQLIAQTVLIHPNVLNV